MKAKSIAKIIREAAGKAIKLAADPKAVAEDRYCVPFELPRTPREEVVKAWEEITADESLKEIRKFRYHGVSSGLDQFVAEPYRPDEGVKR